MSQVKALSAEQIRVAFGGLVAVDGVCVAAEYGKITSLIGPNGAGKTTTFNVCCGFQRPTSGTVLLDGADITRASPQQRSRLGVGRTFQRLQLFRSLTVRQNVELASESHNIGSGALSQLGLRHRGHAIRDRIRHQTEEIIMLTGLSSLAHKSAAEISTGQGRIVELARALAGEPRVLLLDEPSSGLDHAETAAFGDLLVDFVKRLNLAVLLVEHDMDLVLGISDHIEVMDFGKHIASGSPEVIRRSHEVQAAYLGRESVDPTISPANAAHA